jgi:hypothetical protein
MQASTHAVSLHPCAHCTKAEQSGSCQQAPSSGRQGPSAAQDTHEVQLPPPSHELPPELPLEQPSTCASTLQSLGHALHATHEASASNSALGGFGPRQSLTQPASLSHVFTHSASS